MRVQKFLSFVVGFSFTLQGLNAFATSASEKDILSQLEKIKTRLQTSAAASETCEVPTVEDCSFGNVCSKFDGKGRDFYLYQNEEGRQVPNFQMIAYTEATDACLGKANKAPLVKDPFVYPKQLTDPAKAGGSPQLNKNFVRYEGQKDRTGKIFKDAQDRIVKLLTSRRNSENAKSTDEMIARITAVEFNFPKSNQELSELAADGCEIPNAFYSPGTHKVTICPQMMNLPDAALFSVLSHELGHSIDPCQSVKPYTRSGDKISSENPFFSVYTYANQEKDYIFKGISPGQNPFKEVISCLQTQESIGVVIPTLKQAQEKARKDLEVQMGGKDFITPAMAATFADQERSISLQYESFKTCHELTGNGHMQEAFSDWIASQTLKQKISEIPETAKAQQYAFESQALYFGSRCKNLNETAVSYLRPLIRKKCPALLEKMESADQRNDGSESHPATPVRVNRIMLATPEIQKALGCHKDETLKECQ
ncbi:hypothetical protein D3C87_1175120 [compost metagenome]